MLWDPEPTNDIVKDQPVWCLGASYRLNNSNTHKTTEATSHPTTATAAAAAAENNSSAANNEINNSNNNSIDNSSPATKPAKLPETPTDSIPSSLDSSLAYEDAPRDGGWPPAFLDDFESRVWMTYRSEFEPIAKSHDPKALAALSFSMRIKTQLSDQAGFSSDSGWGCMIRSGQSLLANAMLMEKLGRGWRRGTEAEQEKKLLSLFADDPRAPYSIHKFVDHGDGPDVYEDNFMKIAMPDGKTFHPTVILVGTRLGIDKITPVYWEALIASLQMPQSIGIAGGRPSSSHYFIGVQGLYFFYLDPHFTRPALPYHENAADYTSDEVETCHTRKLRRLHIKEMDPSMLIGFLIRSEDDWVDWRRSVKHVQGKSIIHVSDHDPVAHCEANESSFMDQVEAMSDDENDGDIALE
ncbi:Cysteine protease atg4 [Neopestalotiopsis sp. 37M]|nr:Cysteine protease atg4 [Neopestalotiopsis sp. 37M]